MSISTAYWSGDHLTRLLKALAEAGIFTRDKRVWAYYALVPAALNALSAVLQPAAAQPG